MLRTGCLLIAILGISLIWWAVESAIPSPAERFYLVFPALLTSFAMILAEDRKSRLWTIFIDHRYLVLRFFLLVSIYATVVTMGVLGHFPFNRWHLFLWECLVATYFILSIQWFCLLLLRGLRNGSRWVANKSFSESSTSHRMVGGVLPWAIFVPLVLPYLLAVLFVHRFKVPNVDFEQIFPDRVHRSVSFQTRDNVTLRGWFISAKIPSDRTVVICHGLGANRSNFLPFVLVCDELHANVLMFDFRGHGESDGHTISVGHHEQKDVLAAIEYLRRSHPLSCRELYGLGISMGTCPLIYAASEIEKPLDGIVLDSPFATAVDLTDNVLIKFPSWIRPYLTSIGLSIASFHANTRFEEIRPIDRIASVRCPIVLIHDERDQLIPHEHSQRLYEAAKEPKQIWISNQGSHCAAFKEKETYFRFASSLLNK